MHLNRCNTALTSINRTLKTTPLVPNSTRRHCSSSVRAASTMADTSEPVVLHYFDLRGRAEVFKLMCAAKAVPWRVEPIDYATMKEDGEAYPFGQCPRLVDGAVDITQSNAIIRHIARKHGLYGAGEAEAAAVDVLIEGVESLRGKYLNLIYVDQLSDTAKATYATTHIDKASANGRNGGAHLAYFERLLARNSGGSGFFVGSGLTAADLCVWEILDLHLRLFADEIKAQYPLLMAFSERVAGLPGIREYLASPLRLPKVNGNSLG